MFKSAICFAPPRSEIFSGLHWDRPDRLRTLVAEMSAEAVNGVAMSGHHYAMGESAATLRPGMARR